MAKYGLWTKRFKHFTWVNDFGKNNFLYYYMPAQMNKRAFSVNDFTNQMSILTYVFMLGSANFLQNWCFSSFHKEIAFTIGKFTLIIKNSSLSISYIL